MSRLLCLLSCRSKKVRPCWQALAEGCLENRPKSCNRVTTTTSKYHPISKTYLRPPPAPSVTCGDSSLPEGAMGLVPCHIGLYFGKVPAVEALSHGEGRRGLPGRASSLWQGSLFVPGIVTAVQDWASTISSRYHPICKQSACRPRAPSGTCGASSRPSGAIGCVPFHIGLLQVGNCLL